MRHFSRLWLTLLIIGTLGLAMIAAAISSVLLMAGAVIGLIMTIARILR
jgi:hypothetical protein